MINALEVPSEIDLAAFSRFLVSQGVRHRVTEEGLNQVIWVPGEAEREFVQLAYDRYRAGELPLAETAPVQLQSSWWPRLYSALRRFPMTLLLILVNILLFPVGMSLGDGAVDGLFEQLMFLPLQDVGGTQYFTTLAYAMEQGEYWRLVTPMVVHFSWLHIVFNLLWVWEIGRRIEVRNGALMLFGIVMLTSVCSNITQYLLSGPGLFGGMSGVVFGLLGHSLVWSRLIPARTTGLPNGIYIFMLVYLAIGFTGAIDLLGLGTLANGAHLGGLVGGLFTGGLAGLLARRQTPHQA